MSTKYNGQGTLVSPTKGAGVRVAISALANTTPISVTTSGAHGFNTGDSIEQEGTSGVADGQYQLTKTDGTHYTLDGTTANGTAATGYAIDYELLPAVTIPANGELCDMGPLGSALEGAYDPIPFLYRRTGKWRLYNQYTMGGGATIPSNVSNPPGDVTGTSFTNNPWSTNLAFSSASVVALASSTTTFQSASDTTSIPPVFASGDLLVFNTSFTIWPFPHSAAFNCYQVGIGLVQGGSLLSTIGLPSVIVPTLWDTSTPGVPVPVSLSGSIELAGGGGLTLPTPALSFCLFARLDSTSNAGVTTDLFAVGPWTGSWLQYRAN